MTIQVTGTMLSPFNEGLPGVTIRFTPVENSTSVLFGVSGKVVTGLTGEYDFPLEDGKYLVETMFGAAYLGTAYINVVGAEIVSPITLNTLIDTRAFCKPVAPTCPVVP